MEEKGTPKTLSCKAILRCVLAVLLTVALLGAVAVLAFAEDSATGEIETVSVSLGEDIIVKFRTTAGTGDGSRVVVVFNGETTEITENVNGVFAYAGVTPQHFNDELTATLYNAEGTQLGEAKTFSVQSYLEGLLKLEYGESGCKSTLQYDAMKELAVDLLNYGAAAQIYRGEDTEHLANAELTTEQKELATKKITVSETDKAVSGEAWVGAGVRFDYKLGLYFVFTAESAGEYTATINNEEVAPEPYAVEGKENCYVIRYNGFNATNMNDVVTAKLTKAGKDDQTFAYSVKSYVKAKGGDDSALANLVNATYAYGFAAVAYSAEYETTHPTFEKAGSIKMDDKGYDFSSSKYGTVTLPALNLNDYDTKVVNNGTATAPNVTTTYTLKNAAVSYSQEVPSADCFELEGTLYSEYTIGAVPAAVENATLTYNAETGYTFAASEAITLTKPFTAYGADLTVTGTIVLGTEASRMSNEWVFDKVNFTVGTKTAPANITVYTESLIRPKSGSHMLVSEGSAMTVDSTNTNTFYLGATYSETADNALIVDGTLTANKLIQVAERKPLTDETPGLYVRKGTLNCVEIKSQYIQIGSEAEGYSGTVNFTAAGSENAAIMPAKDTLATKYLFEKGTFTGTCKNAVYVRTTNAYLFVGKEMTIKDLTCTTRYVFATSYNKKSNSTTSYTLLANDIETSGTISYTNFLQVVSTTHTRYLATYDIVTVKIGEKTYRVRAIEDNGEGNMKIQTAYSTIAKGGDYQVSKVSIADNTVLTATGETVEYGNFGTFTRATYNNGANAVWYQIIAEVTE